jgi:hypothetical protein
MHLNDISNPRPHITDKMVDGHRAYTAPTIADWVLNRKEKTSEVIQNADSYAQFVNAVYFTKEFGFLPKPEKEALVEQVDCWGEEDQYIDKNQDKHIADFCNKVTDEYEPGSFGEIIHEYDEGTPDHVRFRLFRRLGRLPSEDVNAQCLDALPKIFHHNCDTDSQWKHGGSVTYNKGDEAAYTWYMEPRHARPLPIPAKASAKCEVWWKATHVEFFISGGLWAGDDYGQSQLLPNLRGCGDVTAWTFDYNEEPKEDGREWEAYGRLPYWGDQWGCVRQAMIDAGADGDFGCGGK